MTNDDMRRRLLAVMDKYWGYKDFRPGQEQIMLSVLEGRRKDKEDISYNLLWGQLALTIFLVACAVLAVRQRMG